MEIMIKSLCPGFRPQKNKITSLIERILACFPIEANELSLIFASDEQMKEFNKKYRKIDRETDVLSFPLGEKDPEGSINLGDIIISIDSASRQAQELGHSLEEELKILIIHGLLHLLNYDHQKDNGEMRRKEEELLSIL